MSERVMKYPLLEGEADMSPEELRREMHRTKGLHLKLPMGARVITAMERDGVSCIYAVIDKARKGTEVRIFRVMITNHPFPTKHEYEYIDSWTTREGSLCWHLFEQL